MGYETVEEIKLEAERCVSCRKPKCMDACPAGFDINSMITNIKEGDIEGAAEVVNNFYCIPSSFNRICPAFCQDSCVVGRKGDPLQILNLKRYLADNYEKSDKFYRIKANYTSKIAIIGSGPAGLTAAHELAQLGYKVTVFEKFHILGGMLAVGIPEYRLDNNLLNKEIRDLEKLGVEFNTGIELGKDFTVNDLFDLGYRAILTAIGAH